MMHTAEKWSKKVLIGGVVLALSMIGCSTDEDSSFDYSDLPTTFDAISDDMSYGGQITREDMLAEMTTYLKTGNSEGLLSAAKLKAMYSNDSTVTDRYTNADLNANRSKQLKNKTFTADVEKFENWIDAAAGASTAGDTGAVAADGQAGIVGGKYLVGPTGLEYTQLIEKGLMGAVLYYQGTAVYLNTADGGKLAESVDNEEVTEGKGTALAHHWDEAYGYFAAMTGFTAATTKEDGRRFWGHYSNSRNGLLGTTDSLLAAFIKGRVAIGNNDRETMIEQIALVRKHWERVVAGTAVHYLNVANDDTDFNNDSKRLHELSEAKAFILSLKYNPEKTATDAQIDEWLTELGDNFWTITKTRVLEIRDEISAAHGLDAVKTEL